MHINKATEEIRRKLNESNTAYKEEYRDEAKKLWKGRIDAFVYCLSALGDVTGRDELNSKGG